MPKNTPYSDLKEAILKLEQEQAAKGQVLKDELKLTYERLNPVSIITNSISSLAGSPEIRNNLIGLLVPVVTGFVGRKFTSASRRSPTLARAGILMLDGLNWYIAQNPEVLTSIGKFFSSVFRKKQTHAADEE